MRDRVDRCGRGQKSSGGSFKRWWSTLPITGWLLCDRARRLQYCSGWMDWRNDKRGYSVSEKELEKLDPRVERLLQLILEARKARRRLRQEARELGRLGA
jgi:hypothetical protein